MITKRATGVLVAGVLTAALTGCSSDSGSGGGKGDGSYTVGVANFTLGGPYFNGMDKAIKARAGKKDVEILSTDAGGDAAKLASNVEDLLSKDVDAVIISGGPLESAPAVLNSSRRRASRRSWSTGSSGPVSTRAGSAPTTRRSASRTANSSSNSSPRAERSP